MSSGNASGDAEESGDQQLITAGEHFLKQNVAASGLVYYSDTGETVPLPVAVLPALLPAACHRFAIDLQTHWLTLVQRVSADDQFLDGTLEPVAAVDPRVEQQMHVYRQMRGDQTRQQQQLSLCLLRIDYMPSGDDDEMRLVEITCSYTQLAGWSAQLTQLHARLWKTSGDLSAASVVADAAQVFADGLAAAYEHYRMQRYDSDEPIILVVVKDKWRSDLAAIEGSVTNELPFVHRRSMEEVTRDCRVSDAGVLYLGSREVAVVYLLVGVPALEGHWETRLMLERSLAVKCPSMRQSLVGLKTVQHALSEPNVIERFAPSAIAGQQLRRTMVRHFTLNDRSAVKCALEEPHRFVLKQNRDGGGHNFFNEALRVELENLVGRPEADAYILMERIVPPTQRNVLVFGDGRKSFSGPTDNEFSYFGVALTTASGEVLYRKIASQAGVRTKPVECNEGGICSGYGALNSAAIV